MTTLALQQLNPTLAPESRDRTALYNDLVALYADDLFRYAFWLCHDRDTAQDLVQETFLRAWKAIDSLQSTASAKSWLLTIVRRENARRFERIQPQFSAKPTEELPAKQVDYDTSAEAFALRQALEKLSADYREPLLLQVIHGYSQKEIAAQLGISVAGAGTRLFRARQQLRNLLTEE
ncbi:MAG: sigma-70 family RNA polymerase sigma factor [Pseudomonadota bacterium]